MITMIALRRDTTTQVVACLPRSVPDELDADCEDSIEDLPGGIPYPKSAGLWAWHDAGTTLATGSVSWLGRWLRLTPHEAAEFAMGRAPWGPL